MLKSGIEMSEEGVTIPYGPIFDSIRKNHGFIDVRGRPDLALRIRECSQSQALKSLLTDLAHPNSKLFTVGCDLGARVDDADEFPHAAGGYIQIMHANYAQQSPDEYAAFAKAVAEKLSEVCDDNRWRLHFILKPVRFKLDNFTEMTGSLWIWFDALSNSASNAVASREALILTLRQALNDECHTTLFK